MKPTLAIVLALLLAALPGCEAEIVTGGTGFAQCDGELDSREETIDDGFDADGDGFVDGANPQCQDNYAPEELDCNDSNADISPAALEVTCNDIDDDCNEDTPDSVDADGDGYTVCDGDCADTNADISPGTGEVGCDDLDNDCNPGTFDAMDVDGDTFSNCDDCVDTDADINPGQDEIECDGADNDCDPLTVDGVDADSDGSSDCFDCDDTDPFVFPGNPEVCDDGIDQNCDGQDSECIDDGWGGNWSTTSVFYTCGGGNVDLDFSLVTISDEDPDITFIFVGSTHPGVMTGMLTAGDAFTAESSFIGACSKNFTLSGSFLGQNSFSANLVGSFPGCSGCIDQTWTITGTR
jgi:hypothetical protein